MFGSVRILISCYRSWNTSMFNEIPFYPEKSNYISFVSISCLK
jgi:hypothetical protein